MPPAAEMILEGVISTLNQDGQPHITPMGFQRRAGTIDVAPFVPSKTLDNLRDRPTAVMNLVDDVRIIAGCLTGRHEWTVHPTQAVSGWRLDAALSSLELEVMAWEENAERPRCTLSIVREQQWHPFRGFNRAQAAVVEAAVLVSRLDFLPPGKLVTEMTYLAIAVRKTAGDHELLAWSWLLEACAAHPRHHLDTSCLT
jgi:hypothetical protein